MQRCAGSPADRGADVVAKDMWAYLLRSILYFLLGVTLLRLFRGGRKMTRSVPPLPPKPRPAPDLDPRDIIDATCRPVDDPAERKP